MNSYETRLNQVKQLVIELDNSEVNSDIDNFLIKWSETYKQISKLIIIIININYYYQFLQQQLLVITSGTISNIIVMTSVSK